MRDDWKKTARTTTKIEFIWFVGYVLSSSLIRNIDKWKKKIFAENHLKKNGMKWEVKTEPKPSTKHELNNMLSNTSKHHTVVINAILTRKSKLFGGNQKTHAFIVKII